MTRSNKTEPTSGQASRTRSIPTPRSGFAIARAADQLLQPASDALVDDVRLRSVERHRVVADVLRRKKDAAAERAEKPAGRNEAGDRQHLDAGACVELLVDLPELRNELLIEVELGGPVAPLRNG